MAGRGFQHVHGTADATVRTGAGVIRRIVLTAGSDAATLIIYDNTAASGPKLFTLAAATGTSTVIPDCYARFATGIQADISGTSAAFMVEFE